MNAVIAIESAQAQTVVRSAAERDTKVFDVNVPSFTSNALVSPLSSVSAVCD